MDFWAGDGSAEGRLGPWSTLLLDGLVFPGVTSAEDPGACPVDIDEGEVRYRIDPQKMRGHDGHRLVVEGYEPTPIPAKVRIYTEAQWQAFKAYLPQISPKIPRTRQKVDAKGKPVTRQPTKTITTNTPLAIAAPVQAPLLDTAGIEQTTTIKVGKPVPVMESYRPSFTASHPVLDAYGIVKVYINIITFPREGDGRLIRVVKLNLWEIWDIKKPSDATGNSAALKFQSVPQVHDYAHLDDQPQGTVAVEPLHP